MKKVWWRKLLVETSTWLIAEIILTSVGLDDLANYSEFIFKNKVIESTGSVLTSLVITL